MEANGPAFALQLAGVRERAEKATALAETEKGSEGESKARPAFALQPAGERNREGKKGEGQMGWAFALQLAGS